MSTVKISNNVSLPVNTVKIKHPEFIPKKVNFEDNKKTMEQVAIAIERNIPVLLVGETGTGKTSLVRHLAHTTNNAFVRVNHNGGTSPEDILGRYIINNAGETEWVDGILIEAMKNGYWYLADEVNAASPEVNFVYHQLLDDDARVVLVEKGHEVVIPHPNFRFFGAMNPPGDYAGTKELNKALMSRFCVVRVDFPAPSVEEKILMNRTGIDADTANAMVKFAGEVRGMHSKEQTTFVFSTRDLIMWGQMYKVFKTFTASAEVSVLNKVTPDDIDAMRDLFGLRFKTVDEAKVKAGQTLKTSPKAKPQSKVSLKKSTTGASQTQTTPTIPSSGSSGSSMNMGGATWGGGSLSSSKPKLDPKVVEELLKKFRKMDENGDYI